MHQNQFPSHARARDPSAEAHDRADATEHQRRVRLVEKLDRARERLAAAQARGTRYRSDRIAIDKAQHNYDHFAAAAARAGLIRPRKEAAQ